MTRKSYTPPQDLLSSDPPMTELRYLGPSGDRRTNRWELTCPRCSKTHQPPSSMLSTGSHDCERCGAWIMLHYNNTPPTATWVDTIKPHPNPKSPHDHQA